MIPGDYTGPGFYFGVKRREGTWKMAGVVGARVLFGSCASVGASSQVDAIVVSRQPAQEGPASAYAGVFRGHP